MLKNLDKNFFKISCWWFISRRVILDCFQTFFLYYRMPYYFTLKRNFCRFDKTENINEWIFPYFGKKMVMFYILIIYSVIWSTLFPKASQNGLGQNNIKSISISVEWPIYWSKIKTEEIEILNSKEFSVYHLSRKFFLMFTMNYTRLFPFSIRIPEMIVYPPRRHKTAKPYAFVHYV